MDWMGLRVEMTALSRRRRPSFLGAVGDRAAETLSFSGSGRVTKSFGIGVAISPSTRSSEALQGELGK